MYSCRMFALVVIMCGFLYLGACQSSLKSNQPLEVTEQRRTVLSDSNLEPVVSTTSKDEIIVLFGAVQVEAGALSVEPEWSDGENSPKIRPGMVFDILNCAGYLGQVRAVKSLTEEGKGLYGWQVELIPSSIRPDMETAVKKCQYTEENNTPTNVSIAFAIYPSKAERVKIKTVEQPDLKALYNSLTAEQKRWRNSQNQPIYRKQEFYEKLENDFAWADTDGDGKVDLIRIQGMCDGTPADDLTCMKILHYSNGEWREVARITPA